MKNGARSSPWWIVIVGVVATLVIGAFFFVRNNVRNQNRDLLNTEAGQVTTLLQSALQEEGSALTAIDAVAQVSNVPTSTFLAEAAPFTAMPNTSLALVQSGRVLAAAGHGLVAGQALPAPLAAAVAAGGRQLFSTPIFSVDGKEFFGLVVGGGPTGIAVVLDTGVNPAATTKNATGPYKNIEIALYATPSAQPDQLIITTNRPLPLPAPVATTYLPIGTSKWLVLTAAKSPLAGSWPNAFPWILLGVGLALAASLGAVVRTIGRRERYAQQLVTERTRALESSQRELVRRERLSAVGEMATMIGHELRNPLGAAINGLYLIRADLGENLPSEVESNLAMVEKQTGRAATLADDLTAYMRERSPDLRLVPFGPVVDDVLEASPAPDGVEVSIDGKLVRLFADRDQLQQIVTNLVTNAYQVLPDGGSVRIAASTDDNMASITVEDSGPGLDQETLDRIFDPFFTTRSDGTGLGLAIVQRLAEAHGGDVAVSNRTQGGAAFVVRLPAPDDGTAP